MRNTTTPREHFVSEYLGQPVHPVSVTLVGAGGSGSQMLSVLARINASLTALDHPGLHVTVWDPDTVEKPNIGRQLFSMCELHQNKAVALVSRFNRFYGTGWDAEDCAFGPQNDPGNILITCVDSVKARMECEKSFRTAPKPAGEEFSHLYWLDLGNGQKTGQCILGSSKIKQPDTKRFTTVDSLPLVTEEIDLTKVDEKDSGPSCSLAEALKKQDLFINSSLAQLAGSMIWSLFRNIAIDIRGFYLNLETLRVNPIKV